MDNEVNKLSTEELISIDYQYALYLHNVGLNEDTMSDIQKQEMNKSFVGGWGAMFITFMELSDRHLPTDKLTEHEIDKRLDKCFDKIKDDLLNFWVTEDEKK